MIRAIPILIRQNDTWQLGLGIIFKEILPFLTYIFLNACHHSTIENFHILSHGNNYVFNKVKDLLCIKKQIPFLNKHLHQHGASFLLNTFLL